MIMKGREKNETDREKVLEDNVIFSPSKSYHRWIITFDDIKEKYISCKSG